MEPPSGTERTTASHPESKPPKYAPIMVALPSPGLPSPHGPQHQTPRPVLPLRHHRRGHYRPHSSFPTQAKQSQTTCHLSRSLANTPNQAYRQCNQYKRSTHQLSAPPRSHQTQCKRNQNKLIIPLDSAAQYALSPPLTSSPRWIPTRTLNSAHA